MMARRRSHSRYSRYSRYDRYDGGGGWGGFAPYVSVAERQAQAQGKIEKLRKAGKTVSPVEIAGRKIATTFWGGAWCDNLERYSDYANRIPRGRTYVRNGSVIDLQIGAGQVEALVSGSSIYTVQVNVTPVAAPRWKAICGQCAGGIDSLVELLQGRFSKAVMAHLCQQETGLFPTPDEITFSCSCPDWASMCKHVAATLYGVGARLDHQPDLLFRLRQVDEQELITRAGADVPLAKKGPAKSKVLADEDLAGVFGVELAPPVQPTAPAPQAQKAGRAARTSAAATTTSPAQSTVPATPAARAVREAKTSAARKTPVTPETPAAAMAPASAKSTPVAKPARAAKKPVAPPAPLVAEARPAPPVQRAAGAEKKTAARKAPLAANGPPAPPARQATRAPRAAPAAETAPAAELRPVAKSPVAARTPSAPKQNPVGVTTTKPPAVRAKKRPGAPGNKRPAAPATTTARKKPARGSWD
jgi:uncharacterized Zn finger protein